MEIQLFKHEEFGAMRTTVIEGVPYVMLKDVCQALTIKNVSDAKTRLNSKGVVTTDTLTSGGTQQAVFIDESNLYKLIFQSRKLEAEKFTEWVTSEVLPSIRKHGLYATDELLNNPDLFIAVLNNLKAEREKNAIQHQQILEMQPKASYYDVVLNCKEAVPISVIAKDYGKSARWMNQKLKQLGVQYKQGRIWLLYQDYAEEGYTCTKTFAYPAGNGENHSKVHTYWTQKGRLFIYDLLKQEGIVPLIERKEAA